MSSPIECIQYAAKAEARGFRSMRIDDGDDPESSINQSIAGGRVPVLRIQRRASTAAYEVTGENHAGHDNEPRMDFIAAFLKERVLPYVDPHIDVSGRYPIELHDSYSYLSNADEYRNCLTFSRRRGDAGRVTLIPNPFQMSNFGGAFDSASDRVPWDQKLDCVYFAGSTTGARDPLRNARVRTCLYALDHLAQAKANLRITSVVQMSDDAFRDAVPRWREIVAPPAPIADNYKYRYLLNVPGNTCAWSRLPMALASKGLVMSLGMHHDEDSRTADVEWYYPFLLESVHYLPCTLETLAAKHEFGAANSQLTQYMIANANRFHEAFLGSHQAALYLRTLLEEIAQASRP
jgi:hypothetical protein